MPEADIPQLINALEATRSNPQNDNWRERAKVLAVDTEYCSEVFNLIDEYVKCHDHATWLINRLKRLEGEE